MYTKITSVIYTIMYKSEVIFLNFIATTHDNELQKKTQL